MASGTTGTAERTNSIQTILTTAMEFEVARGQVFGQFPKVPTDGAISGVDAGQTVQLRYQKRLPLNTGTINEKADITPRQVTDDKVSVTINEYGDTVQIARFGEIVTKGNLNAEVSTVVANQLVGSMDRLAGRQYYEGNSVVFRANASANRSDLDSTNDVLSASGVGMSFLARATSTLRGAGTPGFQTDGMGLHHYATVIHTALGQDLPDTSGYLPALQYKDGVDTLFNGEMGEIRGLLFTESEQGKVYPGAGATAQAATTLNGAVVAGATTVIYTSNTGAAVGDIWTLGTLEDGATVTTEPEVDGSDPVESFLVTAYSGSTATVAGFGNASTGIDTPGLRYDHASLVALTEADLVAAIPVFGPDSVMKAFASEVGEFGQGVVSGPFDRLKRFLNIGWYSVVGWNKTHALWTVRLEVATKFPAIVINE